jgi:hypothetical protein
LDRSTLEDVTVLAMVNWATAAERSRMAAESTARWMALSTGPVLLVDRNVFLAGANRRSGRHNECAAVLRGDLGTNWPPRSAHSSRSGWGERFG